MAGGSDSAYPTPPKSSSSPILKDGLLNLQFGTYNPNPQKSDALISKGMKTRSDSATPSTDPVLRTVKIQNAPATDSLLARKCQDTRSEEVKLIEGIPVVSFDIGDKAQLVSKVNFVIVAKFSHGRPIFRDFQAFLSSLKFRGQFVVSAFDRKHVFIEFVAPEDFVKLWMMKSCVVKGFKVRFFRWTESFSPSVEISIAPVWVSLPGLPLYFLEEKALTSIASVLGKPLYIDPLNLSHQKVGAAWICVALDVSKSLPKAMWLHVMDKGKVLEQILQRIVYLDLPAYCKGCYHLGHDVEDCKMRYGDRSNTGFEISRHDEIGVCDNPIPAAVVMQGKQWATRAKNLEEGETARMTVGEESYMNEAKQSSVGSDSRIKFKMATDMEHKTAADANPFEPLQGIKNTEVPLNQVTQRKNAEDSAGHSTPNVLVPTVDDRCDFSEEKKELNENSENRKQLGKRETEPIDILHHFVVDCVAGTKTLEDRHKAGTSTNSVQVKASQTNANKGTTQAKSPSWSDSVDQNLPVDYSILPFQKCDDALAEDTEDSYEEGECQPGDMPSSLENSDEDESSEDEQSSEESNARRVLEQQLDKFQKVSQELSSAKNTRIICKKHVLPGITRGSYSEEEEAERVPEDFNLDPLMTKNGEFLRLSKLTESRAKLIRQRSTSPVGRPSTKLRNLQTKLGSIDLEDNCAILMSTDKYEKTQEIKVTRRNNHTKEVCNTPKRRGRPKTRRNSPPKAQEPRKRGRPKKRM